MSSLDDRQRCSYGLLVMEYATKIMMMTETDRLCDTVQKDKARNTKV
jgi:hypothetical protein